MTHYLDPHNEAFVASAADAPAPHTLGYAKAREGLETLQKHEPTLDIVTETIAVPMGEETTSVVIFRHKNAPKICPMVFYAHGGGWVMGR